MRCKRCDALITSEMVHCAQCGWVVVRNQALDERPPVSRVPPRRREVNVSGADLNRTWRFSHSDEPFRQLESLSSAIDPMRTSTMEFHVEEERIARAKKPKKRAKKARNKKTT